MYLHMYYNLNLYEMQLVKPKCFDPFSTSLNVIS